MLKTPKEVAETLKISVRSVLELIRTGRLNALRIGRRIRVLDGDLDRFVADNRREGIR